MLWLHPGLRPRCVAPDVWLGGPAPAHLRPPGANPGRAQRRLPPGLPGPTVPVPEHRPRPDRPSRRLLRPRGAGRHADHLSDPPVPTRPARRRGATGTINRETSALHRMGTLAVHWGWLDTVPGFPDRLRENPPRQGFFEHPEWHCQVDERRACRSLDGSVSLVVQQAPVTASHSANARLRSQRWCADRSRCRPTRKRFSTSPWTARNRCTGAADVNRRICRSRCRVG